MTAIDRFKERIEKIQRRLEEAKTRRGNKELIRETDIVLSESLALLAETKALQKDNAANLALIKRQCDELAEYRAINHDSAWHNLADVEQIKALQDAHRQIIIESGKVDKDNWPKQQQICQAIARVALGGR